MQKKHHPILISVHSVVLKIFFIVCFILPSLLSFSQEPCLDECKTPLIKFRVLGVDIELFEIDIIRENTIDLIEKPGKSVERSRERKEKAWKHLDTAIRAFDSVDLFKKSRKGVGCYILYLSYAKLAVHIDRDPEFRAFLKNKEFRNIEEVKQKGLIAAKYAQEVWNYFKNNDSCTNERRQINNGYRRERELKQIICVLENSIKPKQPDLIIADFIIKPNIAVVNQTIEVQFLVSNPTEIHCEEEFYVTWYPFLGHPGKHKSIKGLNAKQDTIITFYYKYTETGDFVSVATVDVDSIVYEDKTNNSKTKQIIIKEINSTNGNPFDGSNSPDNSKSTKGSEAIGSTTKPNSDDYPNNSVPPVTQDPTTSDLEKCNALSIKSQFEANPREAPAVDFDLAFTPKECGCINYYYEFPKSIIKTTSSDELDVRLFKISLPTFLKKYNLSIQDARIEITGKADNIPFKDNRALPIPAPFDLIKGGSINDKSKNRLEKTSIKDFSQITNNKELAYTRAMYILVKLMEIFDLKEENFSLSIFTNDLAEGSKWRGVDIRICWDDLPHNALKEYKKQLPIDIEKPIASIEQNPTNKIGDKEEVVEAEQKENVINTKIIEETTQTTIIEETFIGIDSSEVPDNTAQVSTNKEWHQLRREDLRLGYKVIIDGILFKSNSEEFTSENVDSILNLALKLILNNPDIVFVVGGHASTLCTDCKKLTERRAEVVYNILIDLGAPKDRLKYMGYGKKFQANVPGLSRAGRKLNQRVTIGVSEIRRTDNFD